MFVDNRPHAAIVYADTSITNADYEKGLSAAKSSIDIEEFRVSFANPKFFCSLISQLYHKQFDVIAEAELCIESEKTVFYPYNQNSEKALVAAGYTIMSVNEYLTSKS